MVKDAVELDVNASYTKQMLKHERTAVAGSDDSKMTKGRA